MLMDKRGGWVILEIIAFPCVWLWNDQMLLGMHCAVFMWHFPELQSNSSLARLPAHLLRPWRPWWQTCLEDPAEAPRPLARGLLRVRKGGGTLRRM